MENCGGSWKHWKWKYHMIVQSHSFMHVQGTKTGPQRDTCARTVPAAPPQQPRCGNHPHDRRWVSGERRCGRHTCTYTHTHTHTHTGPLFTHEKEGNPVICHSMDGPWGQCAKWDVRRRKTNAVWHHIGGIWKGWIHRVRGWNGDSQGLVVWVGGMGRCWSEGTDL